MFTVFQCCPELELQYCNIGTSRLPLRKTPDVFLRCWLKTNAVHTTPLACLADFSSVVHCILYLCPNQQYMQCATFTFQCKSCRDVALLQCSVRIHLLYKFAWIFSKLTDPVWWLLNKSTPWLAMDLSCYSISSIKEELFFQHDSVHSYAPVCQSLQT